MRLLKVTSPPPRKLYIEADDLKYSLDSSKRAVDAADNMVHAYDFNMEVPLTPSQGKEIPDILGLEDRTGPFGFGCSNTVNDDASHRRNFKRRRSSVTSGRDSPHKIPHIEIPDSPIPMVVEPECQSQARNPSMGVIASDIQPHHRGLSPADAGTSTKPESASDYFSLNAGSGQTFPGTPGLYYDAVGKVVLNSRPLKLRELLHEAVHESLRTGGRPDFTKITETPRGERVVVEVAEVGSVGEERKLVEIEVIVDEIVPESMISEFTHQLELCSDLMRVCAKLSRWILLDEDDLISLSQCV